MRNSDGGTGVLARVIDRGRVRVRSTPWVYVGFVLSCLPSMACRVHPGANHLLLTTRMNSGFDADVLPPLVEVSAFSRFDGVHGPTFERAQTIPVVTSFRRGGGDGGDWPPYTGTVFAAGAPAMAIADGVRSHPSESLADPCEKSPADCAARLRQLETEYDSDSLIQLSELPKFPDGNMQLFGPGEAPPMWFGSDESMGLQLEFMGPSFVPLPQSVHAGYRRKEFLLTPLRIDVHKGIQKEAFEVRSPAVLAAVGIVVNGGRGEGDHERRCACSARVKPRRVQFFATGKAATRMAVTEERVRNKFLEGLVQE